MPGVGSDSFTNMPPVSTADDNLGTGHWLLRRANIQWRDNRTSSSRVTTYCGDKGTILGPWATSEIVDTINASTSGAVVMSPSVLSNGGQNFGAWLRHQ